MAYSLSTKNSFKFQLDDDLKGSVDFDFFGSDEPCQTVSSNNNAITESESLENSENKFIKSKGKETILSTEVDLDTGTPCPSPARQQPEEGPPATENVTIPPLRIPSSNDVTVPSSRTPHSPSSSYSSTSSSLSQSESLPTSTRTSKSSQQSYHTPSPAKSPESQRPRSPSPTPRSRPLSSSSDISGTESTDLPGKLAAHCNPATTTLDDSDISSESDVTDVSPLSSHNASPMLSPQAMRRTNSTPMGHSSRKKLHNSGEQDPDQLDLETIMRAILKLDQDRRAPRTASSMSQLVGGGGKNRSFSAERCRTIDSENQRLLASLLTPGANAKQPALATTGSSLSKASPQNVYRRPASSALNRQRQQRKIEDENKAILRRIKNVRPTRGMTRNEQLNQYEKIVHGAGSGPLKAPGGGGSKRRGGDSASLKSSQSHRPLSRAGSASALAQQQPLVRCRSANSLDRMSGRTMDQPAVSAMAAWVNQSDGPGKTSGRSRPTSATGRGAASPVPRGHQRRPGTGNTRPRSRLDWPQGW